ncbi:glycosyltransferase family 4 protein [Crassaminicella indica]|uniref:Undecaprenyl/decaprenyl-phosphate alpha-N-acetylglucosaminyl 1-phosphate transferase n=1 Tax=Crassaminicella indica TaxID=2855394 RepID=A0ABX8RD79_9CLOT|nr:MraY family glycosyltransferase [Crassaminicella indica]QXM06721.1 undecaprenyl/decaprenyl-phosphate alpha-N-acetylglucosaminyl 1-phosphate transferase [Crassaminicella indica]
MNKYFYVFFVAAVVSFCMTPLAKKIAHKVGAIDVPKDERRVHKKPIPRMGGLAIFWGFIVSVLAFVPLDRPIQGMLIGGSMIIIMGIMDDLKPLSAKVKLVGQIISAAIAVYYGIKIQVLNVPFIDYQLNVEYLGLGIPVTIFWIVGITNTLNLIDGLDGLAAGVATIAAISLSYVAYFNESYIAAMITLAIAGSCIGFLPYNFNPAKIFMGDTGSLFLGYMLAVVSVFGLTKGAVAIATVVPVLALGLPIFDTTFAIARRILNGRPIMEPDKGHLHHKLLSTGMGQKRTVIILYVISGTFGVSAALMTRSVGWDSLFIILAACALMYISIGMQKYEKQKTSHKE